MPETPTPRLGLYRPKSDGSDPVNILTDLNNNFDRIDAFVGFQTQPTQVARLAVAGAYIGMAVRQADTGAFYALSALPASNAANWTQLPTSGTNYGRIGAGIAPAAGRQVHVSNGATGPDGAVFLETTTTAPANRAISLRGSGDTQDRFEIDYDGSMQWGPGGSAVLDAKLSRTAAGVLTATGKLIGNAPGAIASRATAQALPDSAATVVQFPTELFDNDGMFAPGGSGLTVVTPGVYTVKGGVSLSGNTAGIRVMEFTLNGAIVGGPSEGVPFASAGDTRLSGSVDLVCVANDVIRIQAFQNNGNPQNINAARLSAFRISG